MASKIEFIIPTVDEIKQYLTEKKNEWPKKFICYYAEKFWNYYESVGWLISGRAKMKNWKAAFCNQWQNLRFPEDIDMLNNINRAEKTVKNRDFVVKNTVYIPEPVKMDEQQTLEFMDDVLGEYLKHPTMVSTERLAACYDWLKLKKLIRITLEQKEAAIKAGTLDIIKGKATIVQFVFIKMGNNLQTFKTIV